MYADIAQRQLAQIRKSAFPPFTADKTDPLHPSNEAVLLVVLMHAALIREAIWNSGIDIERAFLLLEALVFSTSFVPA